MQPKPPARKKTKPLPPVVPGGTGAVKGTPIAPPKTTATDRAKAAGTPGGFMAAAKREKARRSALIEPKNDAHVQEYFRWKNRQR